MRSLRLYPDPNAELLGGRRRLPPRTPKQVFVGNGSDEVLAHVFTALLKHDAPLLFPDITYSFYPVYCRLFGIAYGTVPLADDRIIRPTIAGRPAASSSPIRMRRPACLLSRAEIVPLLAGHPGFGGRGRRGLCRFRRRNRDPAGRLAPQPSGRSHHVQVPGPGGFTGRLCDRRPDLIEALTRVKDSFNSYPLGRPAQAGAIASRRTKPIFSEPRPRDRQPRAADRGLAGLGFDVLPSSANFVFARHPAHEGAVLATALRQRAVIVRHFKLPRIDQFLRITVGTDDECKALIEALGGILG